jgi:peptidoglycan/LPS O-acetylase OafA/YrhL
MKSPMPTSSRCLYTIELTRGMAALLILVLHVILFGHDKYGFAFTTGINVSYQMSIGIDIFFIISGFLMVHTTRKPEQRKPKEFLAKRFIRIYPAYWLILFCIVPFYLLKPEWAFFHAPVKPSLLLSFLLLPQPGPPLLNVAWTLVYEVYFYLLFAVTLFLKPRKQALVLGSYFCLSILIGYFIFSANAIAQFLTSGFLLEFYAGMILAYLWPYFPKMKFLPLLFFAAAGLLLYHQPFVGISRSIDLGLPAFLFFMGTLGIEKNTSPFPDKIAHFFGRISYALYLVHVPILAGFPKLAGYFHLNIPPVILLAMAVITSIIASVFIHYHYEIKIQKSIKAYFQKYEIPLKTCAIEDY